MSDGRSHKMSKNVIFLGIESSCDGDYYGDITVTCPSIISYPSCVEIYGSSIVNDNACTVIDQQSQVTTCQCETTAALSTTDGRRSLTAASILSSGAREIVPIRVERFMPSIITKLSAPTIVPTAVPTPESSLQALYPSITFTLVTDIKINNIFVFTFNCISYFLG